MAIPNGYFGGIYPRSGLATKRSVRMANCVGVIDADYRGNVIVPLHNDSNELVTIEPHERVAQLIIQKYEPIEFIEVEDLDETERGEGGFGSTGTK
jgi:dUTP pyrophosphatase